jgi:hypothetical protein
MAARGRISYESRQGDRFMYEVGQADSWRERKVEVSLRQKMLNVFMMGILVS